MKKIQTTIEKNLMIYIEVVVYALILGVNVFFGFEIYNKIIGKVQPSEVTPQMEVASLNSLDSESLESFREDQKSRKNYDSSFDVPSMGEWQISSEESPFVRE